MANITNQPQFTRYVQTYYNIRVIAVTAGKTVIIALDAITRLLTMTVITFLIYRAHAVPL